MPATSQSQVAVLISYDLKEPPGGQTEFKQEMEKLKWQYQTNGKPLPRSTCSARFQSGISEGQAVAEAQSDIAAAVAILHKRGVKVVVERVAIMAANIPPGEFLCY